MCHPTLQRRGNMPWTYLPERLNPHHPVPSRTLSSRQLMFLRVLLLLFSLVVLWLLFYSRGTYLQY